ncbi:HAD family hydrolase [Spiroplasma endosymbiont of Labia minor]|uniref:HAD family hydrolase n=1 Tax=Spiroplasma endosymbiont of Labia minor TaxID=3066305 RepID=UPI0030CE8BFD
MIKMIALDIDGTLVHKGRLPKKNLLAIQKAKEQGLWICLASGRSPSGIFNLARKLGLWDNKSLMVGYNGGTVFKFKENGKVEIIWQKMINHNSAWTIYKEALDKNLHVFGYSEHKKEGIVAKKIGKFEIFMKLRTKRKLKKIKFESKMPAVNKFIIFGNKERVLELRADLVKKGFSVFSWSYISKDNSNIEVNPADINKANGLKHLIEFYGLKSDNVAFFGDGENDAQALEWSGYAVAMGNAKKEIQEIAHTVVEHASKAGVGKEIERILDRQK